MHKALSTQHSALRTPHSALRTPLRTLIFGIIVLTMTDNETTAKNGTVRAGGWNRPSAASQSSAAGRGKAPAALKGALAGLLVAGLGLGAYFLFVSNPKPVRNAEPDTKGKIREGKPAASAAAPKAEESHKDKVLRIRKEMNEQVKEFVKHSPTNKIEWVVPPLDPNDPDNALRTSIARDIGTLLSIRPGEEIPPCIPFSFMFEDDAINAAAARGDAVVTVDGGNKRFLEDLKKWKVTIKEGDSEARIQAKNDLVDAQLELLKGIDEGVSVNDSIRAAYQYRIEAAKTRKDLMNAIKEMHKEDPDVETTRALVKKANEQLVAEGIIPIHEEAVIPEEDLIAAEESAEE